VQADNKSAAWRRHEYQRRLRRFLYAGSDAVMLEGIVERKTWLHQALSDLMMLVWHGESESAARSTAMADLARLEQDLADSDPRLAVDGSVCLAFACVEPGSSAEASISGERPCLYELLGQVLASSTERPLARHNEPADQGGVASGVS
jgi:adenylate cyclase